MTISHKLHAHYPGGFNLVNNGGFTQYAERWAAVPNTSPDRSDHAIDIIDREHYKLGGLGFTSDQDGQLGFWDISGAAVSLTVAPKNANGSVVTSRDGGNVLKMTFTEDGLLFLNQEFVDVKRFEGATISVCCSGINFKGLATVSLKLLIDGEETELIKAAAGSFGNYRRFGGYTELPENLDSLALRIEIFGCVGEELGLSGVFASLGQRTNILPFSSSFLDLAVPSGVVYMVAGESCPPGYAQYGDDGDMALVSGTKSCQSINNFLVRSAGQTHHDHTEDFIDSLREPSNSFVETGTPIPTDETTLVLSIPFGDYPQGPGFNYEPYPGEAPEIVLGPNHSHRLRTKMRHDPPTFPVRFCIKL